MSTEELRRLATRAEGIEGRPAARLDEIHGRIRTARRRRATAGVLATAGVVVAIAAASAALTNPSSDTDRPPVDQSPDPNPTETDEAVPAGQTTIRPNIGPGDIRGWELSGSISNDAPGTAGDTDLSLVVETRGLDGGQSYADQFCRGDSGTWWVLTYDLDGVDGARTDGGPDNGTRARFGQCQPDAPPSIPAPTMDLDPGGRSLYGNSRDAYPMRMFVTDTPSAAAQECLRGTVDSDACLAEHGLVPLAETDATFGFGVYEHTRGPLVLQGMGGTLGHEALAIADGVEFLVQRAVVSAPDAEQLVVQLPASDRRTIVAVFETETEAAERCGDDLDIEVDSAESQIAFNEAFERHCHPTLKVLVDGQPAPEQEHEFYLGPHQTVLPPGGALELTVEVVKNDPRNIQYAMVVWEERS